MKQSIDGLQELHHSLLYDLCRKTLKASGADGYRIVLFRQNEQEPVRDKAFLNFVRSLPCATCGSSRYIQAHHVGQRGMGQKASDRDTIPLCQKCHKLYHDLGKRDFVESSTSTSRR